MQPNVTFVNFGIMWNDYKNLQGSNYPWFCISCCNEIFPFGTLTNENFLSMTMVSSSLTTVKNSDTNNANTSSSLEYKLSANLPLLCCDSNYYDNQFQLQNLMEKISHYPYFL